MTGMIFGGRAEWLRGHNGVGRVTSELEEGEMGRSGYSMISCGGKKFCVLNKTHKLIFPKPFPLAFPSLKNGLRMISLYCAFIMSTALCRKSTWG